MSNDLPEKCRQLIKQNMEKMKLSSVVENMNEDLTIYLLVSQVFKEACPYCYQPKEFRKAVMMTKELADSAIKFALNTFPERMVKFCLFGGEPTTNC